MDAEYGFCMFKSMRKKKRKNAKRSDWQKTVTSLRPSSFYILYNQIGFSLNLRPMQRREATANFRFRFGFLFWCIRFKNLYFLQICCEIGKWCMKITSTIFLFHFIWFLCENRYKHFFRWFGGKFELPLTGCLQFVWMHLELDSIPDLGLNAIACTHCMYWFFSCPLFRCLCTPFSNKDNEFSFFNAFADQKT